MEWLTAILGGASTGGLFGLIGTGIHAWMKAKELQAKLQYDRAMRELDLQEIAAESEARRAELEIQAQIEAEKAAAMVRAAEAEAGAKIRTASYRADKAAYGGGWVDSLRGIMRPVITVYTLALMTAIGWMLYQANITMAAQPELWAQVVGAAIMLATTSVTWWFGARGIDKVK